MATKSTLTLAWQKIRSSSDRASLARGIGAVFIIQSVGYVITYVMNVLLARWLHTVPYGTYVYAFNWVQFLAVIGALGYTSSALKFVPRYQKNEEWHLLKGVIQYATRSVFLASCALTLLLSIGLWLFTPQGMDKTVLIVGIWVTPLFALQNLYQNILRGLRYVVRAYLPSVALQPLLAIIFTYPLLPVFEGNLGLAGVCGFGLSILVVLIIELFYARHDLIRLPHEITPLYQVREWSKISFALLGIEANVVVVQRVTVIIIGFLVDPAGVAIYAVAERIASITIFMLASANAVFAPMISPLYEAGNIKQLRRLVVSMTQWTFICSFAVSAGLIIFSKFLLGFFGKEFESGQTVLIIIVIGQLVNAATGPVNNLLMLTEYQSISLKFKTFMGFMSVALNFILIPIFGIVGAAVARSVVLVLNNIVPYLLVRHYMEIDTLAFLTGWRRR